MVGIKDSYVSQNVRSGYGNIQPSVPLVQGALYGVFYPGINISGLENLTPYVDRVSGLTISGDAHLPRYVFRDCFTFIVKKNKFVC